MNIEKMMSKVCSNNNGDDVQWLVIEDDTNNTGGWYLFAHRSIDEPSLFDSWHLTRQEAENEAQSIWSIKKLDWLPYECPGE
jgi:hypothetical protein